MNSDYLNRARLGDSRAMRSLSIKLRPRLSRMAAYYANRCREEAGDLEQEAWLGVLEALPRLDMRIGDPEQSLLQYARWRLLDAIRRSLTHCKTDELNDNDIEGLLCRDDLDTVHISGFLMQLAPMQRTIALCLLAGYTWRETGHKVGCTSANVAHHVRRIGTCYLDYCEIKRATV